MSWLKSSIYIVAYWSISDCLSRECLGLCSGDRHSVGVHKEPPPRSFLDWLGARQFNFLHLTLCFVCAVSLDHKTCETRYAVAWLILDPCLDFNTVDHDNSGHMMSNFWHLKWNISQLENKASTWCSNYSKTSIHHCGASWDYAGGCQERFPGILWEDQGYHEKFVRHTLVTWLSPFFRI